MIVGHSYAASYTCPQVMRFFFLNYTATTEIYTLPLHDPLPICPGGDADFADPPARYPGPARYARERALVYTPLAWQTRARSEEHTSELQSRQYLVCRLLLEKKNADTALSSWDNVHGSP